VLRGGFDGARERLEEPLLRLNSEPGEFFPLSHIARNQADSVSTRDCSERWRKPARKVGRRIGCLAKTLVGTKYLKNTTILRLEQQQEPVG